MLALGVERIHLGIYKMSEMLEKAANEHVKAMQGIYDVLERVERKLLPR